MDTSSGANSNLWSSALTPPAGSWASRHIIGDKVVNGFLRRRLAVTCLPLFVLSFGVSTVSARQSTMVVRAIVPPEKEFFAKLLDYQGILIKAPAEVEDEALFAAQARLSMMLSNLPAVCANLKSCGAELHIIGRNQVTSDLPEWRFDKGKPLPEYNGLTIDQRTRGMGGRISSCGEENLLKLEKDRYLGRDICVHEFSHCIYGFGIPREVRARFRKQYKASLAKGLWEKA